MPLDPVRVEDTRAWLAKAHLDLRSARVDIAAEPPIFGIEQRLPLEARPLQ